MSAEDFLKSIIQDIEVDLTQEFDKNFERKAFFNKKWPQTKHTYSRGSLLLRSGRLRRSVRSRNTTGQISWSSNLPYASLHNEGGEIIVNQKMKRFFWAMFYKSNNAIVYNVRKKAAANTKRNRSLSTEANKWKALALLKIGTKLTIDQRQYIGWHPEVDRRIKRVVDYHIQQLNNDILNSLRS